MPHLSLLYRGELLDTLAKMVARDAGLPCRTVTDRQLALRSWLSMLCTQYLPTDQLAVLDLFQANVLLQDGLYHTVQLLNDTPNDALLVSIYYGVSGPLARYAYNDVVRIHQKFFKEAYVLDPVITALRQGFFWAKFALVREFLEAQMTVARIPDDMQIVFLHNLAQALHAPTPEHPLIHWPADWEKELHRYGLQAVLKLQSPTLQQRFFASAAVEVA